ncbi:DUF4238 domain-containing protein [Rufibacter quisquiliarum]|uniref:DUF4238 domain-containing protein n=1 Tax=Rufibacter quisquiliarum TaxID=1549639 RepID=A0A839GPC0_9BACT|nr:DUF4238 domain-containing protein [Rufibacter quisquiliarum]MBA9076746.1 hypothetical protein [Rufibacter quisquiliarum]
MAEKKNQHYIPKFYLKHFSIEGNNSQIGLFYIEKEYYKKAVPLKSQAKEDYFYGSDGVIEEDLSKLESLVAPVLRKIDLTGSLPPKESAEYHNLLAFTILMSSRTKDSAEQMKEITDKLARELMSHEEQFKDKINDLRVYPENPAALALSGAVESIPVAYDLKAKVLINKTGTKLITSDHPVVKYNQFLEQRNHKGGNIGIATKGLQIFFPISPNKMLCFFDENIYKIGDRTKNSIELNNSNDIEKLNLLQVLNCYNHLYFNHEVTDRHIKVLYNKAKSKRNADYTTLRKASSYIDSEGQEHILYHSFGNNIEIKLLLSFIKQTKKAKQLVLNDYVVQLRNEALRGS